MFSTFRRFAIWNLLFLVSLLDLSEQKPNRRPQPQPEISLIPCKICRQKDAVERTRTYRSVSFSETGKQIEDTYRQDLNPKEHIVPIANEKIVLGDHGTVLKVARDRI